MAGRLFVSLLFIVSLFSPCGMLAIGDDVKFDAPAILTANPLIVEGISFNSEKIVEVVIPVSSQIHPELRESIDEFRYDVFWNRSAYPIFDYGPKTQTYSGINGLISIERRSDTNRTLGIGLKSGYEDMVNATAEAQFSKKNGSTISYQEVPQHDVLVASGTLKRGTGAFFRFHPSKKDTLEGGRDLVVAFRVPGHWRGGILQIECRAEGEKKRLGPWGDEIRVGQAFVMPVYLEGDDQAREIALEFVQTQMALSQKWKNKLRRQDTGGFKQEIESLFGATSTNSVPSAWAEYLIQTGDDRHYDRYYRQLSEPIRSAAIDFIQARKQLISLAR